MSARKQVRKRTGAKTDDISNLYSQAAKKVISQSLHIKKGDSVTVETWTNGLPFARRVVAEARNVGAIPAMILEDEEIFLETRKTMPKDVMGVMGKQEYALLSATDAYVFLPGPPLGNFYPKISGEERSASMNYNTSWYEAAEKAKLRGVRMSLGYAGRDSAKLIGKTTDQIVKHQLKSIIDADFRNISATGKQIANLLVDGAKCTISSPDGSMLDFELKGDTSIEDAIVDDEDISQGNNMTYVPPGYVQKSVDSFTVSGKTKLPPFVTRAGLVRDATLEFQSGNLVKWGSRLSKDKLDSYIGAIPDEKRKLSGISIGLNPAAKYGYSIDRFVSGAISLILYRSSAAIQKASLSVNGAKVVENGKLKSIS